MKEFDSTTLHSSLAYRQRSPRFVSSELDSLCCDNRLAVFVSTEHRSREHRRHVRTSSFRSAKLSLQVSLPNLIHCVVTTAW